MTNFPRPLFRNLLALQDRMNQLFDDMATRTQEDTLAPGRWSPLVDIYETSTEIILLAEVPGVTEEELELQVSDNVLILKGDRKRDRDGAEESIHRLERAHGPFVRTFTCPERCSRTRSRRPSNMGSSRWSCPSWRSPPTR